MLLIRTDLDPFVIKVPELAGVVDVLGVREQLLDDVQRLVHARRAFVLVELEEAAIADQTSATEAVDQPPMSQVVEEGQPLGDHERVVVGQVDGAGAETDAVRQRRGLGDEQIRCGNVLVRSGVVFADPHLVEAEPFGQDDLLQFEVVGQRPVRPWKRFRHQEQTETHCVPPWTDEVLRVCRNVVGAR